MKNNVSANSAVDNINYLLRRITLDWSMRSRLAKYNPADFVTEYKIRILCRADDAEEFDIGKAQALFVRGNLALNKNRTPTREAMLGYSQGLRDLCEEIFDDEGKLVKRIKETVINGNILYVQYTYLKPEYRGRGLEKMILFSLLDEFSTYDGVAIIDADPFKKPLFEGMDLTESGAEEYEIAAENLRAIWFSMGFEHVKEESKYLFFPLIERVKIFPFSEF